VGLASKVLLWPLLANFIAFSQFFMLQYQQYLRLGQDMPKLYEYFGLIILFYSNEHEPVHVHGKYHDTESKAEFIIVDGKVVEIRYKAVKGRKPLDNQQFNHFKILIEQYAEEIVQKWIDYFVLHRSVPVEKITRRIQ
jgi:hypothetical protein